MPEPVYQAIAIATLQRLGYKVIVLEGGFALLHNPNLLGPSLKLDFSRGPIPWADFKFVLEYEGVDVARFLAEMDSM